LLYIKLIKWFHCQRCVEDMATMAT
jgi:hypothetical protein